MKSKKQILTIYLSLGFLLLALYRYKFIDMPTVYSGLKLGMSFIFLFSGFLFSVVSQQKFLIKGGICVSARQSIAMVGLNIFTKYIPGKIMTVMGKALHLSEIKGYSVIPLSILFLQIQIFTLWCGLLIACIGLFFHSISIQLCSIGLIMFILFSMMVFSNPFSDIIKSMAIKVLHRNITFYNLSNVNVIRIIHWFIGTWILWGIAFYLLASSLSGDSIAFPAIFCFPLAGTIGIIALFAPGGVGVRESIIVGYLTSVDVDLPLAITISAVSRLWFLFGELFIFILGTFCQKRK